VSEATGSDGGLFEAALAAAMEQMPREAVGGFNSDAPPMKTADEVAAETTPAPSAPAEPVAGFTAPPPADAAPPAPSAKELERIAALEERERKLAEREASAAESKAQTDKQWKAFLRNPLAAVRQMNPDLTPAEAAAVAESFYVHALGDKAPADVKQRLQVANETTEVRSEVEQLRAELEELRAARTQDVHEAERAKYRAELRAGAASVKDTPIVANLLQREPEYAEQLLFEVARQAAVESQSRDGKLVVYKPEQAARELERHLAAQRDRLYGPATTPAPNTQPAPASPTLSNRDASVHGSKRAVDLSDPRELRRAALKAAGLEIPVWD
jgi:hypothetical protein